VTRRERLETIAQAIAAWWRIHARDMPWRRTSDPYAIWVSEVMLQQTQVATVIPYYRRWMARFPDVSTLARASLADVLKCWEGLGYYGRARNLHEAARQVVSRFAGRLPPDVTQLRTLPGVGPYTAGAVASIAFGLDEPVLDGNVERVLCRTLGIRTNPKQARTARTLWSAARRLVGSGRAGAVNQALMDLGATVCTRRAWACERCPLAGACVACERGLQADLPVRPKRRPVPHHTIAVGIIRKRKEAAPLSGRDRILIGRRKPQAMLGGLWEFPGGKVEPGESPAEAVRREVREEVGIEIAVGDEIAVVNHAYSHFRITLHAFVCRHVSGRVRPLECTACRWVRLDELDAWAMPRANRKIIEALRV